MATNLYEELDVARDASPEEIRKAYRKRALETHPDRVADADKERATEEFRKLGAAYEVLKDPTKRQEYDTAGVWPPPQAQYEHPGAADERAHRHYRRNHRGPAYDDYPSGPTYADHGRHRERDHPWPQAEFFFMDPFRLFEETFADMFNDPFFSNTLPRRHHSRRMRPLDPYAGMPTFVGPPFTINGMGVSMGMGPGFPEFVNMPSTSTHRVRSVTSQFVGMPDGRWVSESHMTRTINGVTESVWQRTDAEGNEHSTFTAKDGRERTYINGVEQKPRSKNHSPTHLSPPPIPIPISPRSHRSSSRHYAHSAAPSPTHSNHSPTHMNGPPMPHLPHLPEQQSHRSHSQPYAGNHYARSSLEPPPPYTPPPPRERRERRHSQEASSPQSRSWGRKW
ncbi:DnaJ-domain-containing protein [Auriscalpium vulgare]|uniref:DnaJ-domain-containing protein n=1 Tax=Auriscalpium vulgare TaxID=40419 RepID=A0ACB8RQL3_9AGAM|nr:DnaJ-domain-containing protein [Auriscalpium vulgare]